MSQIWSQKCEFDDMNEIKYLNGLSRDHRRVVKYARLSPSLTFAVPPPLSLSGLKDEVWHRSEPYVHPETWTYVVRFWSDNDESFILNTEQAYRLPLL